MSLQISLGPNYLTERPDDFMAIVRNMQYKSFSDVIKQLTGPGSILKETECVAVINAFWNAIAQNLQEGIGYNSEQINITPGAGGVFDSDDEPFNATKHWKDINISAGVQLRKSIRDMKVEIVKSIAKVPFVKNFFDIRTQGINQIITPGYMADITGDLLKIEGENSGVFFINTVTGEEISVARIHSNTPKKLCVVIPENIPVGSYKLEVRTHVKNTKDLRTGVLNAIISVA